MQHVFQFLTKLTQGDFALFIRCYLRECKPPILQDIRLTELLTKIFGQLPQSIPTHWFYQQFRLQTPLFPCGATARAERALQLLQQLLISAVKSVYCRHLTKEQKQILMLLPVLFIHVIWNNLQKADCKENCCNGLIVCILKFYAI